jgi:hypothetical protein
LNPTNEAIEHGAVFCQTGGLWRIFEGSKLKTEGFDDIKTTRIKNGKYRLNNTIYYSFNY